MTRAKAVGPRRCRRSIARASLLVAGAGLWVGVACASGPFTTETTPAGVVLVHRKLGYTIARPPWATSPGWRAIEVEEADLAYRDARGSAVSLSHRCRRTRASVAILARHVTIGTTRTTLHAAGPTGIAGQPAWQQRFDTVERGVTVHVAAVTVHAGACVYDFILVSPDAAAFEALEPVFDDWVASWGPPAGVETEGVGPGDPAPIAEAGP